MQHFWPAGVDPKMRMMGTCGNREWSGSISSDLNIIDHKPEKLQCHWKTSNKYQTRGTVYSYFSHIRTKIIIERTCNSRYWLFWWWIEPPPMNSSLSHAIERTSTTCSDMAQTDFPALFFLELGEPTHQQTVTMEHTLIFAGFWFENVSRDLFWNEIDSRSWSQLLLDRNSLIELTIKRISLFRFLTLQYVIQCLSGHKQ